MSFSEILRKVTEDVEGSRGAAVVGMDGIAVDEFLKSPGVDLQSMGAEFGNVLKVVEQASGSLRMGDPREMAVMTEAGELLIRKINEDYFLALLMGPGANLGKGRFAARIAAGMLEKEF